jgi:TonB family protein
MRSASIIIASFVLVFLPCERAFAQTEGAVENPQVNVVMVKLSPPTYPPLALTARLSGDVQIELSIGRDGRIESANVVDGHPLLKQAALESVQKSTFECRNCRLNGNLYALTYSFTIRNDNSNCKVELDKEWRVRSPKCLYLWKCSVLRTFRPVHPGPVVEVTQSSNHVTITASPGCLETLSSPM